MNYEITKQLIREKVKSEGLVIKIEASEFEFNDTLEDVVYRKLDEYHEYTLKYHKFDIWSQYNPKTFVPEHYLILHK